MRGLKLKGKRGRSTNSGGGAWFPWYLEIPLILAVGRAAVWWFS